MKFKTFFGANAQQLEEEVNTWLNRFSQTSFGRVEIIHSNLTWNEKVYTLVIWYKYV